MTSNIIQLSDYRNPGNGAREALARYQSTVFTVRRDPITGKAEWGPELAADHLLTWLWAEGFKVVPVEEK